jgi:hypothetical protein
MGSILYYARAVDMMVLMTLNSIPVKQAKAKEKTMGWCIQLLDYPSRYLVARVWIHTSDII